MKNNSTSNNSKLVQYSAVAGALIATSAVNAQAINVDVNPDVVLDSLSSPYQLDFNNDSNPELTFSVQYLEGEGSQSGIQFTYAGVAGAVVLNTGVTLLGATSSSSSFTPTVLNTGDAISSAGNFAGSSTNPLAVNALINAGLAGTFPITQGAFLDQNYKYLGAKFTVGANTHYGWVQLSIPASAETITIHSYGFNQTPDATVTAGEAGNPAGLENVAIEDKVTFFNTLNSSKINVTPDLIGGEINLVSMSGQIVKTVKITDIETVITYDGIDTGIYSVNAKFESGSVNKKVYVK
jgi:hypothetical protein